MANKKILDDGLTNKQRILRMVERWADDIPIEQALYHMYAMKEIMEGIKSAEEGECRDHDEVFDELERRCDEEENRAKLVPAGGKAAERTPRSHRGGRHPKNSQVLHKPAKKIRKRAS